MFPRISSRIVKAKQNNRNVYFSSAAIQPPLIKRTAIALPPPIKLTERAADRIKDMIKDKDDVVGVKVSVKRRGCNGYSYIMNYANHTELVSTKDEIVKSHGVTVLVDLKAIFFIVGTTMDYEETELSTEFTFINPNSKGECGCGESFNV